MLPIYWLLLCLRIHSDIKRFRPWSPIATENHLDWDKISKSCSGEWHRWIFFISLQTFRDRLRGELPLFQIFMNDGPNPLTWDAQLLSYWINRNSAVFKISSWIWSIISEMVSVLDRLGRKTSQVENSPRLPRPPSFYGGIRRCMFPRVSVRMAWISFDALPYGKKYFITARVSLLLKFLP